MEPLLWELLLCELPMLGSLDPDVELDELCAIAIALVNTNAAIRTRNLRIRCALLRLCAFCAAGAGRMVKS